MIEFGSPIPYDIRISGSNNQGFIVTVGCATCVFSDKESVKKAIEDYLDDPESLERRYNASRKGCEPVAMPDPGCCSNTLAGGHTHSNMAVEECMDEGPCDCGPDHRR